MRSESSLPIVFDTTLAGRQAPPLDDVILFSWAFLGGGNDAGRVVPFTMSRSHRISRKARRARSRSFQVGFFDNTIRRKRAEVAARIDALEVEFELDRFWDDDGGGCPTLYCMCGDDEYMEEWRERDVRLAQAPFTVELGDAARTWETPVALTILLPFWTRDESLAA